MKKTKPQKIPVNETPEQQQARYARYQQEEIDKIAWLQTDPDSIISDKQKSMGDEEIGIAFDRNLLSMEIDESLGHLSKELKTLTTWDGYEGPVGHCLEFEPGIYDGMDGHANSLWVRIKKTEWIVLDQDEEDKEFQRKYLHHIYLTHKGWEVAF